MTWLIVLLIGFALGLEYGRIAAGRKLDWKRSSLAAGIAVILAIVLALWLRSAPYWQDRDGGLYHPSPMGPGGGTACTMEARQCPDGSYVGRSGPRCEFAPCPGR